ncbi:hypothetical protein Dsin_028941 [Dipteronia sinensis]|uniref:DUF4283 domain-containing protein n=1 Tax=Dipteronia sinensis TaxID=43782 RepID=A0AAD9ZS62_9ROSI|nr:hypothetical protein Dsin_028941 [Dipteronia sinensis]
MDPMAIARLCASLSLLESEGPVRKLEGRLKEAAMEKIKLSLVGKILSTKSINSKAFMKVIAGCFRGPWIFDNAFMVLEKPVGQGTLDTMNYSHTEFWVRIYQVSLLCMTKAIGWFLGEMIGETLEVDGGASGDCVGKFLHVRVRIDVCKPLQRCLRVDMLCDGVETVMLLRYERLPNHCFKCGLVAHRTVECAQTDPFSVINGVIEPQFGIWLRASNPFRKPTFRERPRFSHTPETVEKPPSNGGGISGPSDLHPLMVDGGQMVIEDDGFPCNITNGLRFPLKEFSELANLGSSVGPGRPDHVTQKISKRSVGGPGQMAAPADDVEGHHLGLEPQGHGLGPRDMQAGPSIIKKGSGSSIQLPTGRKNWVRIPKPVKFGENPNSLVLRRGKRKGDIGNNNDLCKL